MATLYETDFYGWTQDQAAKLRKLLAEHSNLDLDFEHIAEEIDSLGRGDRREMRSQLARLFEHLLKLEESTLPEPRRQWTNSVRSARLDLAECFGENPSLYAVRHDEASDAYAKAVRRLEPNLIELSMDRPPRTCPYDLDEQALNPDWFPHPRDG